MNKKIITKIFLESGSNDHLRAENFNKKVNDLIEAKKLVVDDFRSIKDLREAVNSTAFPIITGNLLSKKVMKAYEDVPKIGLSLVDKFTSNLKIDQIPGIYEEGDMKEVKEGEPYSHHAGMAEKYATVGYKKYGKILDITEEMIKFDQTGLIMRKAAAFGAGAARFQEKLIMNTVQDIAGYKAWYPAGTQVDLYSTSTTAPHRNSNQITNALAAWDDLEAAELLFGDMTKENGDPVDIEPNTLLVPKSLKITALRLIKNTQLPGAANEEMNPYSGAFKVVFSPYLDVQSKIIWYLGDFKKQFVWKEVMPISVLTRKDKNNDAAWDRDIAASYKVRLAGACGATDFMSVVKSTGAV